MQFRTFSSGPYVFCTFFIAGSAGCTTQSKKTGHFLSSSESAAGRSGRAQRASAGRVITGNAAQIHIFVRRLPNQANASYIRMQGRQDYGRKQKRRNQLP